MAEKGIRSLYHLHHRQVRGQERHPTFYLYRQQEKAYHIDYCFGSADIVKRLVSVEVGSHEGDFWADGYASTLGIFFTRDFLALIPQVLSVILLLSKPDGIVEAIWTLGTSLLILFAYGIVSYFLIFRTGFIIDKLRLESGFNQDGFPLNIHRSTVLSISIIVIGGLIVADTIPTFCQQLFSYYQQKRMTYGLQNPEISYVVFSGVKILIGVLLLTNHRQITRFIEWKRKH